MKPIRGEDIEDRNKRGLSSYMFQPKHLTFNVHFLLEKTEGSGPEKILTEQLETKYIS